MAYTKLKIEEFGKILLDSGDLDPVYIALNAMEMPEEQLARWLVAYWCLYHPGTACWLSERETDREFWVQLWHAAQNKKEAPVGGRWPRASERRHWRGAQAEASHESLREFGSALDILNMFKEHPNFHDARPTKDLAPVAYEVIDERVRRFKGFGPWIAFKVGDMLDRLDLVSIDFNQAAIFMFKDPRLAAIRLYKQRAGIPDDAKLKDEAGAIDTVVDYLLKEFQTFSAPPLHDRSVGLQEVETILCKWKSHMNGHYPLYNDLIDIREGLEAWESVSPTAAEFKHHMPVVPVENKV